MSSETKIHPFYTIGHSNRSIDAFVQLLADVAIEIVADVRTIPRSGAQPQFNAQALFRALQDAGIRYEHLPALGGLRKRARILPHALNGLWQNQSFHNYADYALSSEFQTGLAELEEIGRSSICAIMCAEAVWWRCHRRIIADYLIAAGESVFHIVGPKQIGRAYLTPGAEVQPSGAITYPFSPLPTTPLEEPVLD